MDYKKFTPSRLLNSFIETVVFINVPFTAFSQHSNLYIPNGCPALVIHLSDSMALLKQSSCVILPKIFFSGLLDKPANLYPIGNISSFLILFRPSALSHLFNIPMCELNNLRYIDAKNIIGCKAVEVYDRLQSAQAEGIEEQYRIIEEYFEELIDSKKFSFDVVDSAIDLITKVHGCIGVKQLCGCFDTSERSLRRNFLLKTGYSPKEFARLCRFKYLMQQLQNKPVKDWSEIVTLTDLYDQSHFIKEFNRYTECSPGKILSHNQQLLKILNGMI